MTGVLGTKTMADGGQGGDSPRGIGDIVIRPARLTDVAGLRAIETSVFDMEQLTARSFRRYVDLPGADLLIAAFGTTCVGYGLTTVRRGSTIAALLSIAVATRASGRGIGTALLHALETAAATRGVDRMRLEVRPDNHAGLSLYARAGFTEVARKPDYYADLSAAIVLEKHLHA